MMLTHFMACCWLFMADVSVSYEKDVDGQTVVGKDEMNWIIEEGLEDLTKMQLYVSATYYIVATITTVGYGDISGQNTSERLLACFLMVTGVVFFAISSGSLTTIIANVDMEN